MVLVRTRPALARRTSPRPTPSLVRDIEALFRDSMFGDSMFRESGFRDSLLDVPGLSGRRVFPAVNVTQTADAYYLRAELPGLDASDLDLSVDQNKITLRGSRDIPTEGAQVSTHRRERTSGSFNRTVALPSDIDAEGVEATYRNGVLTVTVPKTPEAKPRQISVNAG